MNDVSQHLSQQRPTAIRNMQISSDLSCRVSRMSVFADLWEHLARLDHHRGRAARNWEI